VRLPHFALPIHELMGGTVDDVHEQKLQAHSIIDRLRFFDQPMSLPDAKRLILAVQSHWAPALPTLSQYLFPQSGSLWENHILVGAGVSQTYVYYPLYHFRRIS
jgi:nucleolar pre-ribosomal-associated protein 1